MEAESTGSLWNGIEENSGGDATLCGARNDVCGIGMKCNGVAKKVEEKEKHRKALKPERYI